MNLAELTCANGSYAWRFRDGARPGEFLLNTTTGRIYEVLECERTDENEWRVMVVDERFDEFPGT